MSAENTAADSSGGATVRKTVFRPSGTVAETRVGPEEFVKYPGSFASYLIKCLEERVREDETKQTEGDADE